MEEPGCRPALAERGTPRYQQPVRPGKSTASGPDLPGSFTKPPGKISDHLRLARLAKRTNYHKRRPAEKPAGLHLKHTFSHCQTPHFT
ncbi:MAG TPA: hypothetical protein VGN34_30920 [Ktedonobacteraceae bacterium]